MKKLILPLLFLCIAATVWAEDKINDSTYVEAFIVDGIYRYNFTYNTTDVDGKTPLVMSGAIFMSKEVHDRTAQAPGYVIANNYTVMKNDECASNVSSVFTYEGFLTGSNYIIIESDGLGLGKTKERVQDYLIGRSSAQHNIDAFIAGRKLIEEAGFKAGSLVASTGYSQGGHTAIWVSKLVEEGYRSDELPKIDYAIIGGGPYDIYAQYKDIMRKGRCQYPVLIPLIFDGLIEEGKSGIRRTDVFSDILLEKMPEWVDTKEYNTAAIQDSIYQTFGGSKDTGAEVKYLLKDVCLDSLSDLMQRVIPRMKANSLVYEEWAPTKTSEIAFVHSTADSIVPYYIMENMAKHLDRNGYTSYTIKQTSGAHVDEGYSFVMSLSSMLKSYAEKHPWGSVQTIRDNDDNMNDNRIFRIDGVEVTGNKDNLPPGIYIINKKKYYVR